MRHAMMLMAALCALVACAEPVIKVEKRPWGTDYTLVSSDGDGDVTLVSVRPKCTKYASQMANMYSDDEYGVGVRAWDIRDEMVQGNGELKVVVKGGRTGATASVIEGPRETLAERFAAAGRAHGATMSEHGGPLALSSSGARLSYMFAEVTKESCEDYIELARRGGQGIIHFHGWWSSLGHYPVNTNYFPGGFADLVASAAKVHAAGLKVGMHTLSGCIDFKDPCLATDSVRDLQHIARYTLAADLAPDAAEMTVREKPDPRHDRVMTYEGNGNVVRIGSELVQYDDFTTEPPYVFKGLKRRWLGSKGGAHKAGESVYYLRQRYLSFYPEPGSALADEVADSIVRALNACHADQVYFDGSEGMGTRYNVDWMRNRLFRGFGRSLYVEASCNNAHNWYFHSRINAWDYPSWNLNAFNDLHVKINSSVRKADLLMPQMGWWAPLRARASARGHLREEMEYCAGKTAALDASFAIAGIQEAFGPPPWMPLEHLTILGWYEGLRTARAFSADALARLSVPGDEYRLRQGDDGAWRLRRVVRTVHRVSGDGTGRWSVRSDAACPAALRVEALGAADESGDSVVLIPAGKFQKKTWEYPYFDAKGMGAFVFDVKGDGSGRTLVLTVKTPREFAAATSEHRVKIDFAGWRRITVLARERDAAPEIPYPYLKRYEVYRRALRLDHISEVSFAWDGGDAGAPPLEIGEVRAFPTRKTAVNHPVLAFGGKDVVVPFRLEHGEFAELEGGFWTHYSEMSEPIARAKGPALSLSSGDTVVEWRSPVRAEVTVTAFREEVDALKPGAATPEYKFETPRLFAPSRGFGDPVRVAVASGERRQLRLEILGAIDRPTVSADGVSVVFPVAMRNGDRLLCRDGREWLVRDEKRHTLATGVLERPLPVLDAGSDVVVSCADPSAADARVLVSTRRVANAAVEPFGVDMYVKSPGPGYHLFRGTRTVATHYPEAGWSVGEMKNGRLCFNIADGSNHSFISQPAIDTSWRDREWNHVAASFSDGKLSLWINGEKVPSTGRHSYQDRGLHYANACRVTSIASPRVVVTNGYDAMTGGRFKGQVVDYRYFSRVLDDAEVSSRAAKVAEMRASDPDAPKMVPDELGIDVEPPCALPNTPLTIQPAPQKAELSEENVLLEAPFAIVLPVDDGLVKVAGEILQTSLARGCGVTVTVVTSGADLPAGGTHFAFVRDAKLGREEYRIEGAPANGGYRVTIYGTDRGYVYAADTLRQLVRIRSIENGRRLSLPLHMWIEDAPLMPHRVALSHWRATREEALGFVRARLNDMWVNSIKPGLTAEKLRQCCAMADSCGVDVISGFGYRLTKPWTFSDPASMDEYKAHIDMLVECGVKGFYFLFDDLSGKAASAWSGDSEMRKRFRSQGAFQNALVHQGLDWMAVHTNFTPSVLIVCPSYYSRSWGEKGKAYYPDFTKGFYERKVLTGHCVFESDDVARLMADGAETYCFTLNGLWPQSRFFTWYTGPVSFRWGWYTWHVDLNGKGPVVNPEAMASMRSIHRRSKVFWAAASGSIANLQTGIISWNPPAYDPDLCDRATAQAYCGTGAYEQLRVFESALMPIIGHLGAYRTPSSIEWDLQVIPRHVGVSKKELAGYLRNYEAAEAAFAALKRAFDAQTTPFDCPDLGDDRKAVLNEMRKTLDIVRKRLSATKGCAIK